MFSHSWLDVLIACFKMTNSCFSFICLFRLYYLIHQSSDFGFFFLFFHSFQKLPKTYLNLVVSKKVIFYLAVLLIFFHRTFHHLKIWNNIQSTNLDYLVVVVESANFEIFCDENNETLLPLYTHFLKENSTFFLLV